MPTGSGIAAPRCPNCGEPVEPTAYLLTLASAARRAGVSLDTVKKWTYITGFPVIAERRLIRIHAARFDEWLAARATGRTAGVLELSA